MNGVSAMARPPGPRVLLLQLLGAAALLLAVLAATVLNRPAPGEFEARREGRALASVDLRFEDQADGGVAVRRADDGTVVAVLAPGTEGFIRATLRGLVRERRRGDLGPEKPFRLSSWAGGGLSLEDLATGRMLDIRAFGPTQVESFARLLPPAKEDRR
jgi:putative photosynthetic complex assembly protein